MSTRDNIYDRVDFVSDAVFSLEISRWNLTKFNVPAESVKTKMKKISERTIIDITRENLSMVPMSRGGNKIEFIVVHYIGVPNADNPNLWGSGLGGHYNIKRNGSVTKQPIRGLRSYGTVVAISRAAEGNLSTESVRISTALASSAASVILRTSGKPAPILTSGILRQRHRRALCGWYRS